MEEIIKDRCQIIRECELCHEIIKTDEDEVTIKDKSSNRYYVLCKKCYDYKEQSKKDSKNKKLLTYFKWDRAEDLDKEYI